MHNHRGSNQHSTKYRFLRPQDFWFFMFLLSIEILGGILYRNYKDSHMVSPVPETRIETVYAKETPTEMGIKEKLAVACIRRFGEQHIAPLMKLVFKESSYNQFAVNKNGGACGLFQAYPCQKMNCSLTDADCQIKWGLDYIEQRYKTPANAWAFWGEQGWY